MVKTVNKTANGTYREAISACYGDTVYFKLEGSMHSRIEDYATYKYIIEDTMPAGLTFDSIVSVEVDGSVNGTIPDTEYEVDPVGNNLTITFEDVKDAIYEATGQNAFSDDKVIIKYSATVNNEAALGFADGTNPGNKNTVQLTYSADPKDAGVTAQTTVDDAYVYCYQIVIDKVDAGNYSTKLENAVFTLQRGDNKYAMIDANGKLTGWSDTLTDACKLITDASGYVAVKGLDSSSTYFLKETKAPAGYNTMEDTISVTIAAAADAAGKLSAFNATTVNGGSVATDMANGSITIQVGNSQGNTLPTTGGMGTTVFYLAGGMLVLAAGALLLSKKRAY